MRTTVGVLVPARSATEATVPNATASGSTSNSSATWRKAGVSDDWASREEMLGTCGTRAEVMSCMLHRMNQSIQGGSAPVERVELFEARVPLSELARGAMAASDNGLGMAIPTEEPWLEADFLFCRLVDENGVEGWGEAYVWLPESGVSNRDMASAIEHHLAAYVLGSQPIAVQALAARMDRNVARNEMAKGLIDIACHELAARQIGRPVHDLIGGATVDRIPLCGLIPLASPTTVAAIAAGYQKAGYGTVRIKLGTGPTEDRDVIAAVRERCGDQLRLRVDYNQAYSAAGAARALALIEPFGIDGAFADGAGVIAFERCCTPAGVD